MTNLDLKQIDLRFAQKKNFLIGFKTEITSLTESNEFLTKKVKEILGHRQNAASKSEIIF